MAVFLNRALSDEVREWSAETRIVLTGMGTETKFEGGQETSRKEIEGGIAGYAQRHTEDAPRPSPAEGWMWAFEEGLLQPFLQAGAQMVDRATIVRLTASDSSRDRGTHDPASVKDTEMKALKGYADLFVEVLIVRSPSSLYGYDFRAVAKEVKTGMIVANVTSLRWEPDRHTTERVVATSGGYEVQRDVQIPPVDDVSRELAYDLMNALSSSWSVGRN